MSKITIGGKERRFSLDFYTFSVAEEDFGVRIMASEFGNISLGDIGKYLWVGLLADDPKVDRSRVRQWLADCSPQQQAAILTAVKKSIGSFGRLGEDDEEPGESQTVPPSIGTESSLSPTGS